MLGRVEGNAPEGEEVLELGFGIRDSFEEAGQGVGQEEGEDEFYCGQACQYWVSDST